MSETVTQDIPEGLLAELERLRPLLERTGGSLQMRSRDGTYRLRVRVEHPDRGRVHRSIQVGDDGAAYAVQELIDVWRREYDARQAHEEHKCEEERAYAKGVKELKRAVLAQASGPSQKRRLSRELNKAAENPVDLHAYLIAGGGGPRPPGRPGPRPRGGLC